MPVLVAAAHRPLPRRLVVRLLDEGGQVRAVASDDVGALRALGVHVAHATPDDEGRFEAACTQVHTVVHLAGGLGGARPDAVVAEAGVVVRAASRAQVRRLVVVTMLGADAASPDPLRRAHAAVEAEVTAADVPAVVVRTGPVATAALAARLAAAGLDARVRDLPVPAVRPDDLVELVVALDRARSEAPRGTLVVAAPGPRDVPLGDLAAAGGTRVGARLPSPAERAALLACLAGPWHEDDPAVPDAWALMGVAPRPVAGGDDA